MAGEIGDGVILFGTVGDSLLKYTLDHIRRGAEHAGKRLKDLYITVVTAFHLRKPGETLENLQQIVGPLVSSECNIFALSVKDPFQLPGDIRDDLMAFKNAYRRLDAPIETRHLDLYTDYCAAFKPEHAPLVTEKMIKETTLTGTPEELQERVRKMQELGVSQVSIAGGEAEMTDFAIHVMQKLQ
jgi:alkanesulfonate monooxygenase SsuD/methylene tetrahydromethanopterin reductase-like flavin-dependent oxidoreductase (luciferase family)